MTARALLGFINAQDQRLMRCLNRWRPPRWFRLWMIVSTRSGDGWLWYAVGLGLLLVGPDDAYRAVLCAGLAVVAGVLLFRVLKKVSGRPRPCAIERHCWATLLPPDQFSFPSGHSITAFAIAVSLGQWYPTLLVVLLPLAACVAVSRVVLGLHYASDVAAGTTIGTVLGELSYLLFT